MQFSTTWRRVRVRNGGQLIELLPAVADAMVAGGTAQYIDEKGRATDINGKLLQGVETASLGQGASERAVMKNKPQEKPRR